MTDPAKLAGCGNPAIAAILARDIDAGKSDASQYVGPCFTDYQGLAIQGQINSGKGDALALSHMMILPELADALAKAINAAALERA